MATDPKPIAKVLANAVAAIVLLAATALALWRLADLSSPRAADGSTPAQIAACCSSPGGWNKGRTEDAGPDDAPVHLVGITGHCYDQKIVVDMLVELAQEYPEHLRLTVRNMEMVEAEEWDWACATYMVKADDYEPGTRHVQAEGYVVLYEKSPTKGGWSVPQMERTVRDILETCGAEPHEAAIAGRLLAQPSDP